MGQWLYGTEGREPTGLSVGAGGGRERFVFKCGLEVGEIDGLSLHTTERE